MMEISYEKNKRLLRYFAFGGLAYLVDLLTFLLFHNIFMSPLFVATSVAFIAGLTFSFVANKLFVFGAGRDNAAHKTSKQIFLYGCLVVFNLIFTYFFMKLALQAGIDAAIAKTMATATITLWNYVLYNKLIFIKQA